MKNFLSMHPTSFVTKLIVFCIFNLSSIALAETYKCTINGATTFSQSPCANGTSTPANIPSGEVSAADYQDALKRNKKDAIALKKLEDARHKEELLREKEMKSLSTKNAQIANKCATLRANEKWAKEDLANATMKTEKKARIKLSRASEKVALSCKAN
jgi:hypothetical protein